MKCKNCGCDMSMEKAEPEMADESNIKNAVLDEIMGTMDDSMAERLPKEPKKVAIIAMKPKKDA